MAQYVIKNGEGVIPEGTTEIGNFAFSGCTGLTDITIPNSVTEIGVGAFRGCTGLTNITIPNSVTEIGGGAFDGCTGEHNATGRFGAPVKMKNANSS